LRFLYGIRKIAETNGTTSSLQVGGAETRQLQVSLVLIAKVEPMRVNRPGVAGFIGRLQMIDERLVLATVHAVVAVTKKNAALESVLSQQAACLVRHDPVVNVSVRRRGNGPIVQLGPGSQLYYGDPTTVGFDQPLPEGEHDVPWYAC
jgi:hypothetical protein